MASLPVVGSTESKRKRDGKNVTTIKKRYPAIDFLAYAELERRANEAARWAIKGIQKADLGPRTTHDPLSAGSMQNPGGEASGYSLTGSPDRLPCESASAYRAFCAYRDLGSQRTLIAARTADRKDSAPGAKISAGHWPRWSQQFHWVARATAHDAMLKSTEERCRAQIVQRRLDFQIADQKRLDARISKTQALVSRADAASILNVTRTESERDKTGGRLLEKTMINVEGINLAGLMAVQMQLYETMRIRKLGHPQIDAI